MRPQVFPTPLQKSVAAAMRIVATVTVAACLHCDVDFIRASSCIQLHVCCFRSFRRRGQAIGQRYGSGSGPILMDDLRCTGSENSLFECRYISSHNCGHSEDISISCT